MILDVRTMYIAMGAICFVVAGALLTLQTRRFQRDGALQWALGWALHGAFWVLLGSSRDRRGLSFDCHRQHFLDGKLFPPLRRSAAVPGSPYNTGILLVPVAATFIFFWYFSVYVDNLLYRVIFISLLPCCRPAAIVWALLRDAPIKERLSYWLTGFAFLVMALFWLNRLVEALTLPYGQLSVLHATTFRNPGVLAMLGARYSQALALCS